MRLYPPFIIFIFSLFCCSKSCPLNYARTPKGVLELCDVKWSYIDIFQQSVIALELVTAIDIRILATCIELYKGHIAHLAYRYSRNAHDKKCIKKKKRSYKI